MLDITCEQCGRVLIDGRRIHSVVNRADGIHVSYACWCGRRGTEVMGRRRRPVTTAAAAQPAAT
jgi:RNase P subunit RPR2